MIQTDSLPVCEASGGAQAPGGWFNARTQLALAACACGGAATFLFAFDPSKNAVYPPCLLFKMTGIYCVGCGATRALYALLHGDVLTALHDNALIVGALPFLTWLVVPYLLRVWRENRWPEIRVKKRTLSRFAIGITALVIGFMALRNVPGWPFELLRPI
jgi:hypothetical protein